MNNILFPAPKEIWIRYFIATFTRIGLPNTLYIPGERHATLLFGANTVSVEIKDTATIEYISKRHNISVELTLHKGFFDLDGESYFVSHRSIAPSQDGNIRSWIVPIGHGCYVVLDPEEEIPIPLLHRTMDFFTVDFNPSPILEFVYNEITLEINRS